MVGMLRRKMTEEIEGTVLGDPPKRGEAGWGQLVVRTPRGNAIAHAAAQARFRARMANQTGWKNAEFVIDDSSVQMTDLGGWLLKQRERHFGTTPRWVRKIGAQDSGFGNSDVWQMPAPAIHLDVSLTSWDIEGARRDLAQAKRDGILPQDLLTGMEQLCHAAVEKTGSMGKLRHVGRRPVLLCTLEELSSATTWFRQSAGTWVKAIGGLLTTEAITASLAVVDPHTPLMPWLTAYRAVRTLPRIGESTFMVQPPTQQILPSSSQEQAYEAELGEALSALPASWSIPQDARRELLLSSDGVVREQTIRRLSSESRRTEASVRRAGVSR